MDAGERKSEEGVGFVKCVKTNRWKEQRKNRIKSTVVTINKIFILVLIRFYYVYIKKLVRLCIMHLII